jgi:hypothetical protein
MSYHRQKSQRITGKHPDECDACEGLGQTRQCETVMVDEIVPGCDEQPPRTRLVTARDNNGRPKCGSGCLKCRGTGRLIQPSITDDDVAELRRMLLEPSRASAAIRALDAVAPERYQ